MRRTRVLVVDDEPAILKFVRSNLQARGYEVYTASDGVEALDEFEVNNPDLVILDIRMPGMDGLEATRRIREHSQVPIIILSALGEESDKVRALDQGTDDYLTKPFGVDELLARVRAVLRRGKSPAQEIGPGPTGSFTAGDLVVDFEHRRVTMKGLEVKLTPTEYELLHQLVSNADKVITHSILLNRVWGPEYSGESEYLRVYIGRLRRKLEPDPTQPKYILTEPGVGYRFRAPPG